MSTLKSLLITAAELENVLVERAGEITQEIEDTMIVLEKALPDKVGKYMGLMDRLKLESENLYAKAEKFNRAAESLENLWKRLGEHVKFQMIENGLTELKGTDETFKLTQGKPAVEITDLSKLPRSFIVETISQRPDKEKIYEAASKGETVPGAELRETVRLTRKVTR